jgi:putative membrane protein
LVVLCIALLVRASSAEASSLSVEDRTFLEDAALATLSQIQFGKIAIRKAVDPQVRAFASQNLSDYSRIKGALLGVAAADQVQLPERLSGEALRDYRRLIVLPRPWFDRLYVYMMYKWHEVALRGFREAAKQSPNQSCGPGRNRPCRLLKINSNQLASFLLKPLKVVSKKTTKRMLIVAFFLGKDRYQADRDCKGRSNEFRRWPAHDSEVLNF